MKRWKLVVVLLVIITLSSPFLFDYILKAKRNHFMKDTFGFNKKEFKVLKETDSHRGFHGDGDYVLILDCSENIEKALEYTKEWTLSSPFLFDYILKAKRNHFMKDTFGFNKKEFKVLKETDSHRGFHGDGDYVLILDCSENIEKALEYTKEWKSLPLTENLQLLMYGGEKEDHFYNYNLADASNFP